MQINPSIFKAYDIRGLYPSELNEEIARQIGRGFAAYLQPRVVGVSRDMRVSSPAVAAAFIDEGVSVKAGARIGPYSVIGRQTQIEENAVVEGAIIWPNCRISRDAGVHDAIVGRNCHIGRNVTLNHGAVLGDKTTLTDFSKV